ncbi:MAG: hypothetical protein V4671_11045 [Armatimonadota bacterium]
MPVYDFETFVRGERPEPDKAMVTITKHGVLSMNRKSYALLGKPKTVILRYDAKQKVVGVRPTEEEDRNAFVVRHHGTSQIYTVAFGSFARHHKINRDLSRRYSVDIADGTLIIDITKPDGMVLKARSAPS